MYVEQKLGIGRRLESAAAEWAYLSRLLHAVVVCANGRVQRGQSVRHQIKQIERRARCRGRAQRVEGCSGIAGAVWRLIIEQRCGLEGALALGDGARRGRACGDEERRPRREREKLATRISVMTMRVLRARAAQQGSSRGHGEA
jgi:hypothetical protein